jgi:cob(I)alamin adenosyltransferase
MQENRQTDESWAASPAAVRASAGSCDSAPAAGWQKGYIHVYTGNGKGKTTAAIGLSIRAIAQGCKVFIGQFLKYGDYGEVRVLRRFSDQITIEQFGNGGFVTGKPAAADVSASKAGIERIDTIFALGQHQVVILEEINLLVALGLMSTQDLLALIHRKPAAVELILTGRHAAPEIVAIADLVTDMREVKHYFQKGVLARPGIEM